MLLTFSKQVGDTDLYMTSPSVKTFLFITIPKDGKSNPKDNRYSEKPNLHCYST